MHSKDAIALGVEPKRLHLVAAWQEAPCYSPRERVALAWCEALTMLPQEGARDAVYEAVKAVFAEAEVVALTLAIVAINGWNRLAVGLRTPVGSYTHESVTAAGVAPGRMQVGSMTWEPPVWHRGRQP